MISAAYFSLRYYIWLGLIIPATFLLSACSKSDDGSDLADAMTTTPEEVQSLADFFNGKSEQNANRAADVAASSMQTNLLIGILAVGVLILVAILLKNKKKN
jgi:hypothetical protein